MGLPAVPTSPDCRCVSGQWSATRFLPQQPSGHPLQAAARQVYPWHRPLFAGEPTGDALSALRHLVEDNVTPETVARIEAVPEPAKFETLRAADMPAWMDNGLAGAVQEAVHE